MPEIMHADAPNARPHEDGQPHPIAEAQAFQAHWELVNAAEQAELQSTLLERKLSQLATLMDSAEPLGWTEALKAEEAEVRERWNRLRAISNGQAGILTLSHIP